MLASIAMRIALLLFLLGACAGHSTTGPAWPKLHAGSDDGGESLAPHVANAGSAGSAATAADATADDTAAATPDTTASDDTAQPADDSTGSADDATIEIDDDGP